MTRFNLNYSIIFIILFSFLLPNISKASESGEEGSKSHPTIIGRSIVWENKASGTRKTLFHDEIFSPGRLRSSFTGKYICSLGYYENYDSPVYKEFKMMPDLLVVVDTLGNVILKEEGVTTYEFNPGKDELAYISGDRRFESSVSYGKAAWILDPRTGNREKILDISSSIINNICDMKWVKFDGNLYFILYVKRENDLKIHTGIFVFDPLTKELSPTPYHGIEFSPDGRYYLWYCLDCSEVRLFARETNSEIILRMDNPPADDRYEVFVPKFLIRWVKESDVNYAYFTNGLSGQNRKIFKLTCNTGIFSVIEEK